MTSRGTLPILIPKENKKLHLHHTSIVKELSFVFEELVFEKTEVISGKKNRHNWLFHIFQDDSPFFLFKRVLSSSVSKTKKVLF